MHADQGDDHRQGRERDRLADPADRADHRFAGLHAMRQALADAKDEKQAVVGPGAEHDHDQDDLGQARDLEARFGGLADQRPGDDQRQRRRQQRHQRRQHRPEDHQQQDDDEQDRQGLGQLLGVALGGLGVDGLGELAGEVDLQARRCPGPPHRRSDRIERGRARARPGEAAAELHEREPHLAGARQPPVTDIANGGGCRHGLLGSCDRRLIGRRQRPRGAAGDEQRRSGVLVLERRRQRAGAHDRGIGG